MPPIEQIKEAKRNSAVVLIIFPFCDSVKKKIRKDQEEAIELIANKENPQQRKGPEKWCMPMLSSGPCTHECLMQRQSYKRFANTQELWPSGELPVTEPNHGEHGLGLPETIGHLRKTDCPLSTSTLLFSPQMLPFPLLICCIIYLSTFWNITKSWFMKFAWLNNNAANPNCTKQNKTNE